MTIFAGKDVKEGIKTEHNGKVEYNARLRQGIFLERPNRFVARVAVDGLEETVHVANPGRMTELLVPGAPVWLAEKAGPLRKTRFQLALVAHRGVGLVSVDSNLPNRLVHSLLMTGAIPEFAGYDLVAKEVKFGQSRFDFRLDAGSAAGSATGSRKPPCFLEVKSVNLVVGREARFPDAPTLRGARHLAELAEAHKAGYRAAVLFVIQRDDAISFAPHVETDPAFGEAFRNALEAGVEAYAYTCRLDPGGIALARRVPVKVHPDDQDCWSQSRQA